MNAVTATTTVAPVHKHLAPQQLYIGTMNRTKVCVLLQESPVAEVESGMIQSPIHLKVVLDGLDALDKTLMDNRSITPGTIVDLIRLKAEEIKVAFLPTKKPDDIFVKISITENGDFIQFLIMVGSCKTVLSC